MLRHAAPNVIEAKLVPAALFVGLLEVVGTTVAVLGALAWALSMVAYRLVRGKPASGLLWLTTLALIARTVAALATGSVVIYFLQPTIATSMVAAALLVSVPLGKPLAERLAMDLVPLDEDTRSHPVVRRFFRHVTLWWGFTSLINFGITLWLLLTHSPTTFVVVKSFLGPATTSVTLAVALVWFRFLLSRSGTKLEFAAVE